MAGLDAIAGVAPSAVAPADGPEGPTAGEPLARVPVAQGTAVADFNQMFAALLGIGMPMPLASGRDAGVAPTVESTSSESDADGAGEPEAAVPSDAAGVSADGSRTAESAAYAIVRDGLGISLETAPPIDATMTPAALDAARSALSSATAAPATPKTSGASGTSAGSAPSVPPVATTSHDEALASVAPALRDKLERVVDRMQREFGHDVRVVEGRRSQARQDALYAQGRTAPGPVVTWTRDSAHLDGHAVDVMIDGGYDNAEAFRTLARVARQEGLKTLGPRDPGHLELADASDATIKAAPGGLATVATVATVAPVATVARPTAVAAPAAVATPAPVARVAVPGARVVAAATDKSPTASTPAAADTTATRAAETARPRVTPRDGARDGMRERIEELAARLSPSLATGGRPEAGVEAPIGLPGVDLTARLEAVARVRDAQASQPLSRLVMDVPDTIGGVDRIAVSLRGQRVDASLAIQDPATAARAAQRVEALVEALGARGYEAGSLAVSAARGVAPESMDLTRLSGLALEREGTRGVASFLQDVSGGGLRDRQHSPSRHPDSHASSRGDDGARGDTPRRQPRRNPGDRE